MSDKKLKIFISWAGPLAKDFSCELANAVQNLAPEKVEVFHSTKMSQGRLWGPMLRKALAETNFGLLIITPESMQSSWVQYEAGAISTAVSRADVAGDGKAEEIDIGNCLPLLVEVNPDDPVFGKSPLHKFMCQVFDPDREDMTIQCVERILEKVPASTRNDRARETAKELHKKLRDIVTKWRAGPKKHYPPIELVSYDKSSPSLFRDLVGNYIAFNAPLVYEAAGNNEEALFDHVRRYKDNAVKAEYFYLIFSLLDEEARKQWVYGIKGFFERLKQRLSDAERDYLTFYVPRYEDGTFKFNAGYELGFTFFAGRKQDDGDVVYLYMHNGIYTKRNAAGKPNVENFLVLRDPVELKRYRKFIEDHEFRGHRHVEKLGLVEFVEYCKRLM